MLTHAIFCVGSNRPSVKLFNKHVRDAIAKYWEDLGIELLDEKRCVMLEIIKMNHNDVRICCTQMFRYWLEGDIEATWDKLIEALEEINQDTLANCIKTEILKGFDS